MERLVALGAVLASVSICHTSTQRGAMVVVDDGRLDSEFITDGTFGSGSFNIGESGVGRTTQMHAYVNEDDNGEQITITQNSSHHSAQQDNRAPQYDSADPNNSGGGNTQLYPVKPQTTPAFLVQRGMGDEEGSGGGKMYVGRVVLPNNKNNKGNKQKNNGNKQPVAIDASAIEAIFGSNDGNNGLPGSENRFASTSGQGSIQIDSITGGKFAEGTESLNNNKRPGANVLPQKGNAVNNGNTGNSNAENEALYSIGHGANSNGTGNAGDGYHHGQINSENSEERWIWSR